MKVSDFDFDLPAERIAQVPVEPRDAARLFVHRREADESEHLRVADLERVLEPGDLLVVNDTRVRWARLLGRRATGGKVELLLLKRDARGRWRSLARPAARLHPGERVSLEEGAIEATLLERAREDGGGPAAEWWLELESTAGLDIEAALELHGRAPLPPYIRRTSASDPLRAADRDTYQTVFARALGAVAAPTAGLHFTPRLLASLAARGVERTAVTLHVGAGTFKPVQVEDTRDHRMHAEAYELRPECAAAVERCRRRGGRVVAVGTTSLRVLESCADEQGVLAAGAGETRLFLSPGASFRVVDALLTNFHLPRSTLLMLVSAFAGRERVLRLYGEAIERGYRFYSYGDAQLYLP
jgi:S-adenosylmethionine:tRNA ribosyltransferase-isomerase